MAVLMSTDDHHACWAALRDTGEVLSLIAGQCVVAPAAARSSLLDGPGNAQRRMRRSSRLVSSRRRRWLHGHTAGAGNGGCGDDAAATGRAGHGLGLQGGVAILCRARVPGALRSGWRRGGFVAGVE